MGFLIGGEAMGFAERLVEIRNARKLSRQELAELTGLAQETIARYERGDREPRTSELQKISSALEVTVSCLMNETDDPAPAKDQKRRLDVGINLDDPEVLQKVLLGLQERKIHVLKVESDPNAPFPGETEPIMPPQVLLPVIDQDACAGAGFDYSDVETYAVDWIPYPIEALGGPIGPHKPYFVKVSGDSMIGVGIEDGCMVAINPNVEVRNGDNVYVRWKGRCSIKGFIEYSDRIELRPANRDYQSTWIPREDWEELKILGKVVRVFNLSVPGSVL